MKRPSSPSTLDAMLAYWAATRPEHTAVVCEDDQYSYETVEKAVGNLARLLVRTGLQPGDTLCSLVPKSFDFVVAFLATLRVRALYLGLSTETQATDLASTLAGLRARWLLVGGEASQALTATARLPLDLSVVHLDRSELLEPSDDRGAPDCHGEMGSPCYLNATSGTTGSPKFVVATHANLAWNCISAIDTFGLRPGDVHLCTFPVHVHPHESIARAIYSGGATIVEEFKPRRVVERIVRGEVTHLMSSPAVFRLLLDTKPESGREGGSLRIAEAGGAVTTRELSREFTDRFGLPLTPVWGSSETTGMALAVAADDDVRDQYPLGRCCSSYLAECADLETGLPLDRTGEIGELRVAGPGVASRYFGSADNHVFQQGWYHTGDLVRRQADGVFYFVGRKHDMVKASGLRVYPLEIETIIQSHPSVREAVVMGAIDPERGERLAALVVPRDGHSLSIRELAFFCSQRLESHKVPRLIRLCRALPRNDLGKVDRIAALAAIDPDRRLRALSFSESPDG